MLEQRLLGAGGDQHRAIGGHVLLGREQHLFRVVVLVRERVLQAREAARLAIVDVGLAVTVEEAGDLLRRPGRLDEAVRERLLAHVTGDRRRLVAVLDMDGRQLGHVIALGEIALLVGVDHVERELVGGVAVAVEEILQLRVAAAFDEGVDDDRLVELGEDRLRLRRQREDVLRRQVPAMVVAGGEPVHHHDDGDEDQRIDDGVGAVLRRALAEDRREAVAARGQVEDDQQQAQADVQEAVRQRSPRHRVRDDAENDEHEAPEAEERGRASAHRHLQRTDSTER